MTDKRVKDIQELITKLNIKDGSTLSFHHHLRNGDGVLNMVMHEVFKTNVKNIKIAPSSLFPVHKDIVPYIEDGRITSIETSYINGEVAKAVSHGKLKKGIRMHTHGGRARAIIGSELLIDVAFIALSCADIEGSGNGIYGKSAFGPVGYAIADMKYAKKVVVITDNLTDDVIVKEIDGKYVDYVLVLDSIGDQKNIVSGTTQVTKDPVGLKIARDTANILDTLGVIKSDFSMQTGAGGISLAVADEVYKIMREKNIKAHLISGGITSYFVNMLEQGFVDYLYDVQAFDLEAVRSYKENPNHKAMSASKYANPFDDPIVNKLDFVILGATEIDLNFNVNVTTDSHGMLIGGSGGHADAAHGAKITVITTQMMKSRMPIIKENVNVITTPGKDIDILVTERGIAVNPHRNDIIEKLKGKIKLYTIEELMAICYQYTGKPKPQKHSRTIIGEMIYRDGSVIDKIYKVEEI